jgi:hypothetical protein
MSIISIIWMGVLFSCTQEERFETQVEEPKKGPYLVEEEAVTAPEITEIEHTLQSSIDTIRTISAAPFVDTFFSLMEESDEQCPQWYSNNDGLYWFDRCVSDIGTLFEGYGTQHTYSEELDASGNQWTGKAVYSESLIESESGVWLSSSGNASLLYGTNINNGADVFYSVLSRGFRSNSMSNTPEISMWASHLDTYKGIYFDVVLSDGDDIVVFSENSFSSDSSCPDGAQSIFTEEGWVQLSWSTEECSGCTSVFFEGKEIGEVCADFSDWLDWEENPWELALPPIE